MELWSLNSDSIVTSLLPSALKPVALDSDVDYLRRAEERWPASCQAVRIVKLQKQLACGAVEAGLCMSTGR